MILQLRSLFLSNSILLSSLGQVVTRRIIFTLIISITKDLIEIIDIAKEKHLKLILGTFEVDCTGDTLDPMVEGMVKMMGVFAELERNMISERVTSGMRNAAAKGKVIGRPHTTVADIPQRFMKSYPLYEKHKINQSELARITGLNRGTVRKYIKMLEEKKDKVLGN